MKLKLKITYIVSIIVLALVVGNAENVIFAAKNALFICANAIVPALFPFFVISSFMINTHLLEAVGKLISPVSKRLFKVSGSGAVVFVMGILCGYPTGAKMISELYEKKMIDKNEALRLLPFCNNSGPLFVIGSVGVGMLNSAQYGRVLYIIHVISAIATGVILSFFAKYQNEKNDTRISAVCVSSAFSDSVLNGTKTALSVCGYIVFFAVLKEFITPVIFRIFGKQAFGLFVSSLMEVTIGAKEIIESALSKEMVIVLTSGAIGFGGVCVLLQVMGMVEKTGLSIKTYVFGKMLQSLLSMVGAFFYVTKVGAVPSFSSSGEALVLYERYFSVLPYILIAVLFIMAYSSARKKR